MYTYQKWEHPVYFNFRYVQYLPRDFDHSKKYPLVLFLHGAGERGDYPELAARWGLMQQVRESGREYPFICISPLCPKGKYWGCYTESLLAFLDWLCENLPVDRSRVYLTGLSMGGTGTYMLAMAAPERFAAIAPICGSGIVWYGEALKDVPVFMYHGDCDEVVPLQESITMLKAIHTRGGHAQLKICYGVGHDAWKMAYHGDELINWLLSHRKSEE